MTVKIAPAKPVSDRAMQHGDRAKRMSDDPFADLPDSDRTVIRPRPGGRASAAPAARTLRRHACRAASTTRMPLVGVNPLVKAASPLLAAAVRLRGRPQHPDPDGLRRRIAEAVRAFEQRALSPAWTPARCAPPATPCAPPSTTWC